MSDEFYHPTDEEMGRVYDQPEEICYLICEYCGDEYQGNFNQAIADGWQYGSDASPDER